jgi:hypothetical protein
LPTFADDRGVKVFPRDSVPYGLTYGEWSAAWRQWADGMLASQHPLFDTLNPDVNCSEGQSGPVWFLGGRFCSTADLACGASTVERSCTVPKGTALYFPILNVACLDAEANLDFCFGVTPFAVNPVRRALADAVDQATGLEVSVDDRPLRGNLKKDFRVQSPLYSSVVPEAANPSTNPNLYEAIGEPGIGGKTYIGVDDGIYVMLKPLRPGDHTLHFSGAFGPPPAFSLDVTYHLTVE